MEVKVVKLLNSVGEKALKVYTFDLKEEKLKIF